ncbi:MAG: hypothetical protein KJO11_16655 [Gemmatimonadetes bacterium]|nr:hypothetical protein [Gemmatimonadota bacterium]MBT8404918.1 hypothetical protein [Gemmatimonadota bacterium]NNF37945.1 hypothetical protein [Gemmatimonadota bacterium]NNK64856.1 hypothetical protein [Gemmatimonadota bacterium]
MLPTPPPPLSSHETTEARRKYAQLLRLQERLNTRLRSIRDELAGPELATLLKTISRRTGTSPHSRLVEVRAAVEEALRGLKVAGSEAHAALTDEGDAIAVEGIDALPFSLARFLAERQDLPGFEYEVLQDEVRGWVIQWREHTNEGEVRGFGQFYERPYAWLDE